MAAGGGAGVITVWNLEERRLHTIVKVHSNGSQLSSGSAYQQLSCLSSAHVAAVSDNIQTSAFCM